MLLLFTLGEARYGIAVGDILEVTPLVRLRQIPQAPPWMAGLFHYRDALIPVIDLCRLTGGQPYRPQLSTRIIVVNHPLAGGNQALGLIAERVTQTANLREQDFTPLGMRMEDAPYLGNVAMHPEGVIQRIEVTELLPEPVRNQLLAGAGT